MTATARDVAGLDDGRVSPTPRRFDELELGVEGSLLRAGDEAWDDALLVWNGMVALFPALVVQPTTAQNIRPRA
jgi:hypothetical protein